MVLQARLESGEHLNHVRSKKLVERQVQQVTDRWEEPVGTACRTWEGFHVPLAGQCSWGEASLALWSAGTAPESIDLEARRLGVSFLFSFVFLLTSKRLDRLPKRRFISLETG